MGGRAWERGLSALTALMLLQSPLTDRWLLPHLTTQHPGPNHSISVVMAAERLSGGKKLPPAQPILGFLPAEKRQVTHAASDSGSCRSIAEFLRFVPPAALFPEKLSHDSRYLGT